jgi:hypothetical protein
VFKSTNRGESWSAVNSGLTSNYGYSLAIDPNTPSTLYAGTYDGGVFKSTNSGGNWSPINDGLTDPDVRALALDPNNPATIYAATIGGGVFSLTQAANSFIFNGLVTDHTGTPLSGATVEMTGNPMFFATTDANGAYSLPLPAGTNLTLKISKAGYLPVYTNTINSSSDIYDPVPAVLFTQAQVNGWGVTPGKGVIAAHAADAANLSSFISGAVATATSANHPSTPYAVAYSSGGSSTASDGLIIVLNVDAGDTVTLHATKNGWSFPVTVFPVQGNSVSEGLLEGVQQNVHIKNTSKYFTTLQAAYNDSSSSSANPIQALVDDFNENLKLDLDKAVTLQGGLDSNYSSNSGFTSLLGACTIESGSLTVENLVIR